MSNQSVNGNVHLLSKCVAGMILKHLHLCFHSLMTIFEIAPEHVFGKHNKLSCDCKQTHYYDVCKIVHVNNLFVIIDIQSTTTTATLPLCECGLKLIDNP